MSMIFLPFVGGTHVILGDEARAHLNRLLDDAIERLPVEGRQAAIDEREELFAEILRQMTDDRKIWPESITLTAPTESEVPA